MDADESFIETQKTLVDYIKHITTLGTGSIVLIATFLEKVFTDADKMDYVVVSVSCFMISIFFLLICGFAVIRSMRTPDRTQMPAHLVTFTTATFLFGAAAFIIALIYLTLFAIVNLQKV
jgi:Na+/melibiose symporter-like transporter